MSTVMVLPDFPGLDIAIHRTPIYSGKVDSSLSQREVAISYSSYPVYEWELKFNALRDYATTAEAAQLLAWFHVLNGRGNYFLYQDPDIAVSNNVSLGIGTGTQKDYRIGFLHTEPLSGNTFFEPVQEATGVVIKNAGVTQTNPTQYTISSAGLVSFVTAPTAGNAITYSGTHRYRCRLLDNKLPLARVVSQIWNASIKFRSVKV